MHRMSDQQLRVVATLSDGTTKDVTAEAEYRSQQPDLVTVDTDGRATTQDAVGEGTVMVRYRGMVEIARLTVPFGRQCPRRRICPFPTQGLRQQPGIGQVAEAGNRPQRASDRRRVCAPGIFGLDRHLADPAANSGLSGRPRPRRRGHLIDQLLTRNEYASYWAGIWGDVLRNKRRGEEAKRGTYAFAAWIRDAFQQNMPYDEFVPLF